MHIQDSRPTHSHMSRVLLLSGSLPCPRPEPSFCDKVDDPEAGDPGDQGFFKCHHWLGRWEHLQEPPIFNGKTYGFL